MNQKGFMLSELIVVSSIVLIVIVGLYSACNSIYSVYKTRSRYYDVVTLYRLGYYRDILKENNILEKAIDESHNGLFEVYNSYSKAGSIFSLPDSEQPKDVQDLVYMVNNNGKSINRNIFSGENIHVPFLEYIDFLESSVDFKNFNYMLIMERCISEDDDNCSYAYLEVWNPKEE